MSGSQFIVLRSKFLLINATPVALGQGHGKVIQYMFPDLYFLCPKYARFSSNSFDVVTKSHCGRGKELKTYSRVPKSKLRTFQGTFQDQT